MERLNRFLIDRTGGDKYATVFYCLLDRHRACCTMSTPRIARRWWSAPNGARSELDATRYPVGLIEVAEFAVSEQKLSPGDKLVIYSDGVTEAQNTGSGFFGMKRLRQIVEAHASESCEAIHDAIQDAVAAFTEGAAQSDDITVLVLEFTGKL